jgi:hypothetical protein
LTSRRMPRKTGMFTPDARGAVHGLQEQLPVWYAIVVKPFCYSP